MQGAVSLRIDDKPGLKAELELHRGCGFIGLVPLVSGGLTQP